MPNLTAETLFKAFASIALADGVLSAEEQAVVDGLAARLGIADADAKRWLADAQARHEDGSAIRLPENSEDALELLEGMVKVAAADGVILPSERKLIEQVRQQLGIDAKRLESLVTYHLSAAASKIGSVPSAVDGGSETASGHFHILAVVALADRELASEELAVLDRIRERLRITPDKAQRIIEAVKGDRSAVKKLELSRPASGSGELFEDMVKIVAADGVIHPDERKVLERACGVLGIDKKRLESLLAYAVPHQPTAPPAEKRSWLPYLVLALLLVLAIVLLVVFVRR